MRTFLASRVAIASLAVAAMLGSGAAFAQLRQIPDEAKRGHIRHLNEMIVDISGTPARLSAGAQIRSRENRIVLPAALPAEGELVKFLVDQAGQVHRVWILTEEEAAKPDKRN